MLKRFALILLVTAGISACGFQLRGTDGANLTNQNVYIVSQTPFGDLEKSLKRDLKVAGAGLVTDGISATIHLNLVQLDFQTQGTARDDTGRANEILLRGTLEYQLVKSEEISAENADGRIRQIRVSRSYYRDYRNPIAEKNLRQQARQEIVDELAQRLARQLEWAASH